MTKSTCGWVVPDLVAWEFDRASYEEEIARLSTMEQELFRPPARPSVTTGQRLHESPHTNVYRVVIGN